VAWQDELVPVLRVLIGDVDQTNYTYTDDSLTNVLLVAAKQVSFEIYFPQAFTASVQTGLLVPDPTVAATRNDDFANLVTLKGAAILDRTEASLYARRGIIVRDGSSAIDLSKVSAAKLALLDKGWNAVYDDTKFEYLYRRVQGAAGSAVLTPFRLFAWETFGTSGMIDGDPRNRNNFFN
jgi:hypothetical protein